MNNKNRFVKRYIWILILSISVLLSFWGYQAYQNHQKKEAKAKEEAYYRQFSTRWDRLKDSSPILSGDKGQFVVAPIGVKVNQNYMVDTKITTYKREDIPPRKKRGYEAKLVSLDLNQNFKRREYDLYEAIDKYKKGSKLGRMLIDAVTYEGRDWAVLILTSDDEKKEVDEYVGLNLATGRIEDLPLPLKNFYETSDSRPEASGWEYYHYYYKAPMTNTSLFHILQSYNLYGSSDIVFSGDDGGDSNAARNLNLFVEKPTLWNKIYIDDYAIYPRPDSVSVEEWFNTSLHWFAPAGGEDLTVYASEKGHRTDYAIHNYAEYQTWKQAHPDE